MPGSGTIRQWGSFGIGVYGTVGVDFKTITLCQLLAGRSRQEERTWFSRVTPRLSRMVSVVAQNKHTQAGSLSEQELVLLYQSFVYIGLRKEVGIFGEGR